METIIYTTKDKRTVPEKAAQEVGEALSAINDKHGTLEPQTVVDEARDPLHSLHHRFEWDDGRAAEAHRRHQARQIIRAITITVTPVPSKPPTIIRAFVSVKPSPSTSAAKTYSPVDAVLRDPTLSDQWEQRLLRDLRRLRDEYASVRSLLRPETKPLFDAVEEYVADAERRQQRSGTGSQPVAFIPSN